MSAVTWDVVSVSLVVKQGTSTGKLSITTLNSRKYLNFVSARFATPKSDLFVGFREDTGIIAVVRKSDETVLWNVVSGISTNGIASNGTSTTQSIASFAIISSLNTDFQGSAIDAVTRRASGTIKKLNRSVSGGFQNQTIKGSFVSTGKKINL